jgi:hypothetical protein
MPSSAVAALARTGSAQGVRGGGAPGSTALSMRGGQAPARSCGRSSEAEGVRDTRGLAQGALGTRPAGIARRRLRIPRAYRGTRSSRTHATAACLSTVPMQAAENFVRFLCACITERTRCLSVWSSQRSRLLDSGGFCSRVVREAHSFFKTIEP